MLALTSFVLMIFCLKNCSVNSFTRSFVIHSFIFSRWLESVVSGLITEEQWCHYLTLLTETIWPQGKLIKSEKLERTEEVKGKTKEEAVQTLSDFFGGQND